MSKLTSFTFVSVNGFYKDENAAISWHKHGTEENEFSAQNLKNNENILLFGRITYEMMAGFWSTKMAAENNPEVAKGMNEAAKIVFSETLSEAVWNNTTLVKGNMLEYIREVKKKPGKNMTLLGSGNLLAQLAENRLIDEYQIMVDPVALGKGTPIFSGIKTPLNLKLTDSRIFKSGTVLLCYEPI